MLIHELRFQCVQYKTETMPDLKKIEKFTGNVMNQLTNKD